MFKFRRRGLWVCIFLLLSVLWQPAKTGSCRVSEPHITLGDYFSLEYRPGQVDPEDAHVFTIGFTLTDDCDEDDATVVLRHDDKKDKPKPLTLKSFRVKKIDIKIDGEDYERKGVFFKINLSHIQDGYETWEIQYDKNLVQTAERIPTRAVSKDEDSRIFAIADFDMTPNADPTWKRLSQMSQKDYDMIFFIGDTSYYIHDDHGEKGDRYFAKSSESARRIPYIITPGNHERYFEGRLFYYRFRMPNAYEDGNSLFDLVYKGTYFMFVNLDWILRYDSKNYAEHQSREREMLAWMESRFQLLQNRNDINWRVFATHRPFECSDPYATDCFLTTLFFRRIADKVAQMGFHISLHAHLHSYLRNKLYQGFEPFEWSQIGKKGPLTIINGHAGTAHFFQSEKNLPELSSPLLEVAEVSGASFFQFDISPKKLKGSLILSDTEEEKDSFVIKASETTKPQSSDRMWLVWTLGVTTLILLLFWYKGQTRPEKSSNPDAEGYELVQLKSPPQMR